MSNKLNPMRINNYNKFLATLDNKTKINEQEQNAINILSEKFNIDTIKNNSDKIDAFIAQINKNIVSNNILTSNFTGQTPIDLYNVNVIEPNFYKDYNPPQHIHPVTPENLTVYKETINIETEVNNVADILNIIEKYSCDPSIKYNINIKALHNIKEPLQKLNNMVGMNDLKNNIVDQILYYIQDLHKGTDICSGDFMHTVIYGPPGTGKTEIAKIMGKIYSKLGILNKGTFKKVTRGDLISGYLGQTALKTRDIIKESLGGVLFIDEAYSLGNPEKKDSFAKECIDTLCEALSDNKENLMVIIAGYEKELKECFFSFNKGLESRFAWRFKTDDYNYEDLYNIFLKKVNDVGWEINTDTKISVEWFKKNHDYFKYYGRDIETLLTNTKISHSKRVFCLSEREKRKLNSNDLDKGFENYLKNDDVKNRNDEKEFKKQLYNSLYC